MKKRWDWRISLRVLPANSLREDLLKASTVLPVTVYLTCYYSHSLIISTGALTLLRKFFLITRTSSLSWLYYCLLFYRFWGQSYFEWIQDFHHLEGMFLRLRILFTALVTLWGYWSPGKFYFGIRQGEKKEWLSFECLNSNPWKHLYWGEQSWNRAGTFFSPFFF